MGQLKTTKGKRVIQKESCVLSAHQKESYTKDRHATRHLKRLPALAKQINEI